MKVLNVLSFLTKVKKGMILIILEDSLFPATALEGHNFQDVSFLWVARTIAVVIIPQEIAILYIAIIKMS